MDDWLNDELQGLDRLGLRRRQRTVELLPQGQCRVDGVRAWHLASNDYLGLSQHAAVVRAALKATQESGVGARASALVAGRTPWHMRLEQQLAQFKQKPAALLFPTGVAANLGTVAALAGPGDLICCDRLNHASLVDGCRMSGAKLWVYRHQALDRLEQRLAQAVGFRRTWIVTDTVFSMDGDVAPLPDLCDLAERYGAELMVDEAHATGVFGACGRGVAEWQGVEARIAVSIGTLSKALGALGGFVVGSQALIDYLWNRARTQVYSTALPPACCAAASAALEVVRHEPERREQLLRVSHAWVERLRQAGGQVPAGVVGPIIPLILGDETLTMQAQRDWLAAGLMVGAIRPPTVPRGTARLRLSLTSWVTERELDRVMASGMIPRSGNIDQEI